MEYIDNIELEKALLSNGVVVGCHADNYAAVLRADEEIALFMAHGISVIIDVSNIINADVVKAVKRFCNTADETGGNLSVIVSVDHPRLQNILRVREAHNRLTLKVNDRFMQALADGTTYGNEDSAFEPDALWNQMAHCNVMFSNKGIDPYCSFEVSNVNLCDFVTIGRDGGTFDSDSFKARCEELLSNGTQRITDFLTHLDSESSKISAESALEQELIDKLRTNTSNRAINIVYATGCSQMMQKMELEIGSEEGHSLMATINDVCAYKIDVVPAAFNGRTMEHKDACIKAWQNKCDEMRIARGSKATQHYMAYEENILKRPNVLEADVVRFQNKKEKWIAFIGLIDGRPYEVFTGIADDDEGIFCPKSVNYGKIIKAVDEHGQKRYDFQFINKRGFKTTIEGLSEKFNPEFWNYAKLISGVLRYGMPIEQVVKLVSSLDLDNLSINNWKSGVIKALKKYLPNPDPEA